LRFARLVEIEGVETWELPEYPEIAEATDDIIHRVDRSDRIDNLAERFLGSKDLWWVIALANEFRLLPDDLNASKEIRIPSARRVYSEILRHQSRGLEGR